MPPQTPRQPPPEYAGVASQPPQYADPPAGYEYVYHRGTPGVWTWYVVYCVITALLYLSMNCLGAFMFFLSPADLAEMEMTQAEAMIAGVFYITVGTVFAIPFAVAPFLPKRGWSWVYGIVIIALGLLSCCFIPACIPLLIFWVREDNKAFFNMA